MLSAKVGIRAVGLSFRRLHVSLDKLGPYNIVKPIGKWELGIVYEAHDPNINRTVALKAMRLDEVPDALASQYEARFRSGTQECGRLQHPNIIDVYDVGRDQGVAFMAMELVRGGSLQHQLDGGMPISFDRAMAIMRDLLVALDFAHEQGILHLDIRPAHLMVGTKSRIKLGDFGVAQVGVASAVARIVGSTSGVLNYLSPEQVIGEPVDARTDLFAAGAVLYRLITGLLAFGGEREVEIFQAITQHRTRQPSALDPGLPASIDAIVAKALAKKRDERYVSAKEFAIALKGLAKNVLPASPLTHGNRAPPTTGANALPSAGPSGTFTGATRTLESGSTAAPSVAQEMELLYWKDIQNSPEPEDFYGFLKQFPQGIYAGLARRRLRRFEAATSDGSGSHSGSKPPPAAPDHRVTSSAEAALLSSASPSQPIPSAVERDAGLRQATDEAARRQVDDARRTRAGDARIPLEASPTDLVRVANESREAGRIELERHAAEERRAKEAEAAEQARLAKAASVTALAAAAERVRLAEDARAALESELLRKVEKERQAEVLQQAREAEAAERLRLAEEERVKALALKAERVRQAEKERAVQAALEAERATKAAEAERLRVAAEQAERKRLTEEASKLQELLEQQQAELKCLRAELLQKTTEEEAARKEREAQIELENRRALEAEEARQAAAARLAEVQKLEQKKLIAGAEHAARAEQSVAPETWLPEAREHADPFDTTAIPFYEDATRSLAARDRTASNQAHDPVTSTLEISGAKPNITDDRHLHNEPPSAQVPFYLSAQIARNNQKLSRSGRLLAISATVILMGGAGAWWAVGSGDQHTSVASTSSRPTDGAVTSTVAAEASLTELAASEVRVLEPTPSAASAAASDESAIAQSGPPSQSTMAPAVREAPEAGTIPMTAQVPPDVTLTAPLPNTGPSYESAKALERISMNRAIDAYRSIAKTAGTVSATRSARRLWEIYRDGGQGVLMDAMQAQQWYERADSLGAVLPAWSSSPQSPPRAPIPSTVVAAPPPPTLDTSANSLSRQQVAKANSRPGSSIARPGVALTAPLPNTGPSYEFAFSMERSDLTVAISAYRSISKNAGTVDAARAARRLWEIYRDGGSSVASDADQAQQWYARAQALGAVLPEWSPSARPAQTAPAP